VGLPWDQDYVSHAWVARSCVTWSRGSSGYSQCPPGAGDEFFLARDGVEDAELPRRGDGGVEAGAADEGGLAHEPGGGYGVEVLEHGVRRATQGAATVSGTIGRTEDAHRVAMRLLASRGVWFGSRRSTTCASFVSAQSGAPKTRIA